MIRLDFVGEMLDKQAQVNALQLIAQHLLQNPVYAKESGLNVEDVINKLVRLTDVTALPELGNQLKQQKVLSQGDIINAPSQPATAVMAPNK